MSHKFTKLRCVLKNFSMIIFFNFDIIYEFWYTIGPRIMYSFIFTLHLSSIIHLHKSNFVINVNLLYHSYSKNFDVIFQISTAYTVQILYVQNHKDFLSDINSYIIIFVQIVFSIIQISRMIIVWDLED